MWITRDVDDISSAEVFFWQNEPELVGEMYEDPTGECDFISLEVGRFREWFDFKPLPGDKIHCSLSLVVERSKTIFADQKELFK
jgi:hypothetical protein